MTRLMQLGASGLHRSWLNIPHVTQFDQADITDRKLSVWRRKALPRRLASS